MNAKFILNKILNIANPQKAIFIAKYFKTNQKQYSKNDVILGVSVPTIKNIVNNNINLSMPEVQILLNSKYHEIRLAGLLFLVKKFEKTQNEWGKEKIFNFYLKNTDKINNWDLVDASCHKIIGLYLLNKNNRKVLYKLANNNSLWEQRIAIVSTWAFIKNQQFYDTFNIAEKLLNSQHYLIHKAVGWMLREIGKKNYDILINFLEKNFKQMPRTMLRSAVERLFYKDKLYFMKKNFNLK